MAYNKFYLEIQTNNIDITLIAHHYLTRVGVYVAITHKRRHSSAQAVINERRTTLMD